MKTKWIGFALTLAACDVAENNNEALDECADSGDTELDPQAELKNDHLEGVVFNSQYDFEFSLDKTTDEYSWKAAFPGLATQELSKTQSITFCVYTVGDVVTDSENQITDYQYVGDCYLAKTEPTNYTMNATDYNFWIDTSCTATTGAEESLSYYSKFNCPVFYLEFYDVDGTWQSYLFGQAAQHAYDYEDEIKVDAYHVQDW